MSTEKCFCHFGEYEVKDAKARQTNATLQENLSLLNEQVAYLLTAQGTIGGRLDALEEHGTNAEEINSINAELTQIKTNITNILTTIAVIDDLLTDVSELQDANISINTSIGRLQDRMTATENQLSNGGLSYDANTETLNIVFGGNQ